MKQELKERLLMSRFDKKKNQEILMTTQTVVKIIIDKKMYDTEERFQLVPEL